MKKEAEYEYKRELPEKIVGYCNVCDRAIRTVQDFGGRCKQCNAEICKTCWDEGKRICRRHEVLHYCGYCSSTIESVSKIGGKCEVCGLPTGGATEVEIGEKRFKVNNTGPKQDTPICKKCWDSGIHVCKPHSRPPCLIVTACYGSSLAKPVEFLREFRDDEVLNTKIGKQFMRGFDKFYYSFSPAVANFLEQHKRICTLVRTSFVALLIHILKISERATRLIPNKEARVFATGTLTTLIIFTVFYLIFCFFKLAF